MVSLLPLLLALPLQAASLRQAQACLAHYDRVCAEEELAGLPDDADSRPVRLAVAFYKGDYERAVALLDQLQAAGVDTSSIEARMPVRETAEACRGFVSVSGQGVQVRYAQGVDAVLGQEALETLGQARMTYDGLFGGGPSHDIRVDIFPTATRFIAASGLPPEAVRTTGIVALSKWSRLLLTSPRALSRGYPWKDTLAHEYIHLVVAWRTQDRTPVWLQEGLAKHLERWWRGDTAGTLSPMQQSLLAQAIHDDDFVPFEKFRRSMAYLDSGREAALAFAQVSTMIGFLLDRGGEDVLPSLMDRVRAGEAPEAVVADLAGFDDFEGFRAGWVAWLRTLPMVQRKLTALPVVMSGEGDDYALDPLLAQRADLARFARLGDLLREADRPRAALVEYDKARGDEPSPLLAARRAACLSALGERDKALREAREAAILYPRFTLIQVTLGRLLDQAGLTAEAAQAWAAAHDLNPYDPEVERALIQDYQATGKVERAQHHLELLRILETGGAVEAL